MSENIDIKNVLMIAYHFPPVNVSSGVHRTLYFAKHLPEYGWHPQVLTVKPMAYMRTEKSLLSQVPPSVPVRRCFALDAARHMAIKGRYWGAMAVPDRWQSWFLPGIISGLSLIRRHRPKVLWTTFPIATAVLIGLYLHRLTRLPWILDLRDPMHHIADSVSSNIHSFLRTLERKAINSASAVVLTTPRTTQMYRLKYPNESTGKWHTIENGYDEAIFEQIQNEPKHKYSTNPAILVHSGLLYTSGRNPIPFFDALQALLIQKKISSASLRVVLRASGDEDYYRAELRDRNLESVVILAPPLDYKSAIEEMVCASGLLLFQGSTFNDQIPAKAYEYLRAGRPILALADSQGETAELLKRAACNSVFAPITDSNAIASALLDFLDKMGQSQININSSQWSRSSGCAQLSRIFDALTEKLA